MDYSIEEIKELGEDFETRGSDGRVGSLIIKFMLMDMERGPISREGLANVVTNKLTQYYHVPCKDFVEGYIKKFVYFLYEASVTDSVENSIPRKDCLDIVCAFRVRTGKF